MKTYRETNAFLDILDAPSDINWTIRFRCTYDDAFELNKNCIDFIIRESIE